MQAPVTFGRRHTPPSTFEHAPTTHLPDEHAVPGMAVCAQ
jgi:hypothetical protein